MKLPRRQFLQLVVAGAALPVLTRLGWAQSYPTRPVHIVIGFAAGSTPDLNARFLGQWLAERLGQPFVIENRPGAGTNIGTEEVARASSDGYTLLYASAPSAINATLYDKLNFNFISDIAPVASIQRVPLILAATPSLPAATVPELIAYAKSNPGKISVGSPGIGTVSHLAGELLKSMSGVDMVHVPYRGGGGALIADLLSGQVQVSFLGMASITGYIHAGKLRALAVTSATRLEAFPDIPTVNEFMPGYDAVAWEGLCAPKKMPPSVINQLNQEVNAWLADPKVKTQLADRGGVPMPMSSAEFQKFIVDETEKWGNVIRTANIKPE